MRIDRTKTSGRETPRERFSVLDFAETAKIPVSRARKLIREFGNDAETLMKAVENVRRPAEMRLR